jgi:hypothetical protein
MTTTADSRTYRRPGHDHPCWCERCLPCTLEELLDERAKILHAALLDRLYTPGLERTLAEELMHAMPAERRVDALAYMVTWCHINPRVMAVTCLLDECDQRSYAAAEAMAKVLLEAIHAQDNAPAALRILITGEIVERGDA